MKIHFLEIFELSQIDKNRMSWESWNDPDMPYVNATESCSNQETLCFKCLHVLNMISDSTSSFFCERYATEGLCLFIHTPSLVTGVCVCVPPLCD